MRSMWRRVSPEITNQANARDDDEAQTPRQNCLYFPQGGHSSGPANFAAVLVRLDLAQRRLGHVTRLLIYNGCAHG